MATNFPILDCPQASPGCCGVCGYSGNDRKYLDPRKDFEFYGTFILCELCVGAMANDFGFLNPEQSKNIQLRLEEQEQELIILRSAVLQLETLGDLVAGLVSSKPTVSNDPDSVAVRGPEPEPTIPVGATESEGSDNSVEGLLNFNPDEQIDESGSDDLSGLAAKQPAGFNL